MYVFYRYNSKLPFEAVAADIEQLKSEMKEFPMPITLCHNDIWQGNCLYDKENGR